MATGLESREGFSVYVENRLIRVLFEVGVQHRLKVKLAGADQTLRDLDHSQEGAIQLHTLDNITGFHQESGLGRGH